MSSTLLGGRHASSHLLASLNSVPLFTVVPSGSRW